MNAQDQSHLRKEGKKAQRLKTTAGVLAILAVVAMITSGVIALRTGQDTSDAMKLPAALAFWSLVAFVYAQRRSLSVNKPDQQHHRQRR